MRVDQTPARDHKLLGHSSWADGKGTAGGPFSTRVPSLSEEQPACVLPAGLCLVLQAEKQRLCPSRVYVQNPERIFRCP